MIELSYPGELTDADDLAVQLAATGLSGRAGRAKTTRARNKSRALKVRTGPACGDPQTLMAEGHAGVPEGNLSAKTILPPGAAGDSGRGHILRMQQEDTRPRFARSRQATVRPTLENLIYGKREGASRQTVAPVCGQKQSCPSRARF